MNIWMIIVLLPKAIELIKRDSRRVQKDNLLGSKAKRIMFEHNLDEQSEEGILEGIKNFLIKK